MAKENSITLLRPEALPEMTGWGDLTVEDRRQIQANTQGLLQAMVDHGVSRLAMGSKLLALRNILEPQRMWIHFLHEIPQISERTAYRYIQAYENLTNKVPEKLIPILIANGIDFSRVTPDRPLGLYTDAFKRLPVPDPDNSEQVTEYVRRLTEGKLRAAKAAAAGRGEVEKGAEQLKRECYRYVSSRLSRLPNNSKSKSNFVRDIVGMLLTTLGVGNAQSYDPIAIPVTFRAQRGRPKKVAA